MKTIITLMTMLILNGNLLFAAGLGFSLLHDLAPVTPKEVSFENADGLETILMSEYMLKILAPSPPKEATFDDEPVDQSQTPDPSGLAPSTPKEADFNDTPVSGTDNVILLPETPKEAIFEEII